jgi:hypothetical protein
MRLGAFTRSAAVLFACLIAAACAEPPRSEMDQAQGAIDAARAAGADRYAAEQYEGAVQALQSAHAAVAARDYRLALNHALDSRNRAQKAAKEAANQQVLLRSQAERRLAELTATVDRTKQLLADAEAARVPRRSLAAARQAIDEAQASLQKAGTGIQDGEYQLSEERLSESAKKLQAAIAEIEAASKGRTAKPRR